jgi:hypothetical protein
MVTVKRPTAKKQASLTVCNLLIVLLTSQLLALVYYFSSTSHHHPTAEPPKPAHQGLRDRLQSSVEQLKKPVVIQPPQDEKDTEEKDTEEKDEEEEKESPAEIPETAKEIRQEQEGEHAFPNFYLADYSYERQNPSFRHDSVPDWDVDVVSKQFSGGVRSCHYKSDDHSILYNAEKCSVGSKLIAYNSAHFERRWCGTNIPAGKAMEVASKCDEPVRLFPVEHPPVSGKDMPPIQVTSSPKPASSYKAVDCDIPCEFSENLEGEERYVMGTEWKLYQTLNDPVKHENAKVERTAFRQDVYYSTTSFKSSVPLSFFTFQEYDLFIPPVDFDKVNASGCYLQETQCASHFTKRNRWAEAVGSQFPTANYGKCAHNTDPPPGTNLRNSRDRINLIKNHRFNLALEFGDAKDHITPVVWEAFASGTLPVVLGASNVKEHFPPDSFISTAGLQHWGDLGALVAKVAGSKEEWMKYHAWRTDGKAKEDFDQRYNFTRTSPECRLCRWAYAKKYGLGWNHQHQYVHGTTIDRTLCLDDSMKLVSRPFVESWHSQIGKEISDLAKGSGSSSCNEAASTLVMTKGMSMKRSVASHDNIMDFELWGLAKEAPGFDVILRLAFDVRNAEGSYFPNPHSLVPTARGAAASSLAIQDAKSKVIVLASWNTQIISAEEGIVHILVRKADEVLQHGDDERKRIRVIIEDMVELYDKATEFFPTSFAKLMVQDFVDPLELFYVE